MRLKQKEKAKLEDGIVIAYVLSESYTYVLVHVHLRKDIYFLLFDIFLPIKFQYARVKI